MPVVAWFPLVFGLALPDGRAVFAEYCSIPYCHGADGGEGRAPILRGRSWHEGDLRRIILEGVANTSMPPFGDRLSTEELAALIDFVRSISHEVDSSEGDVARTSERAPWDLASGRALFHGGGCAHCHRFGRADRAGPDLSRAAGKRPFEVLRDIVDPGAESSSGKPFVQVETTSGENFSAIREEGSEAHVRVHDLSTTPPVLRRIPKAEIVRVGPLSGSAMPAELWKNFDARQLRDLVFYVRSKGAVGNTVPEVATRPVDIWSDGTRLSGDLFYPTGRADKLPAIVMSHGWGGVRSHLNEAYAPYFAAEGFVVLTLCPCSRMSKSSSFPASRMRVGTWIRSATARGLYRAMREA